MCVIIILIVMAVAYYYVKVCDETHGEELEILEDRLKQKEYVIQKLKDNINL